MIPTSGADDCLFYVSWKVISQINLAVELQSKSLVIFDKCLSLYLK